MPMHDWTRVDAGLYHDFHLHWTSELCRALNAGLLPSGFVALTDQRIQVPFWDVLINRRGPITPEDGAPSGGVAVAPERPKARFVIKGEAENYVSRANRIKIQHRHGHVVAVIEILSPGNKDSQHAVRSFVTKSVDLLYQGINLLIVDPFPPSDRDPEGINKAIWDAIETQPFALPADQRLTVAAYQAAPDLTAYIEPFAVGEPLPRLPIFLTPEGEYGVFVYAPLEETYQASWAVFPADFKPLLEGGPAPPQDLG
jgi:hypothetical protein